MSAYLHDASRVSAWKVDILDTPSGELELFQTSAGFVWFWKGKPDTLVALAGVLDAKSEESKIPYRFFELDGALWHLMDCTRIAFQGLCGLHGAAA